MTERESKKQPFHPRDASSAELPEMPLFEAQVIADPGWFFASMLDELPVNIICKDIEGRLIYVNQAFAKFLGKPAQELIGKTDDDVCDPELAEKYKRDDRLVLQSGQTYSAVEAFILPDGETHYFDVQKTPLCDPSGKIMGVKAVFWDVTAEKRAQAAADHERFLLDSLLNHIPDSIYFKDKDSRFVRTGIGQAEKFGFESPSQIKGKTDADIFTAEHADAARRDELEIMRSGKPILSKVEKETWAEDRPDTWCSTTKMAWRDASGEVVGTFGISRDVTDLVLTEEALRKAKIAADAANQSKSDFLANMSHEIRTPMNAVIGITELLLDTKLTENQREYMRMVLASGESLLALINDILDFSKIEAGKLKLDCDSFHVRDSFGDTARVLGMRAHAKNLELAFSVDSDVPRVLIGDLGRLRQIIINLVGNAIKFTNRGEVVLKIELDSIEGQNVTLKFSVIDTGIGIPESKLDLVFEEFEQADASTTRDFGGTGLGLAITSRLIELMGGRIWVESVEGEGSTFAFTARLKSADGTPDESRKLAVEVERKRVLIVDDNSTNRLILRDMLLNWGMEPETAASANEALAALHAALADQNPFQLILTDVNMPAIDGFQMSQSIRNEAALADVPIIILTSGMRDGDNDRARKLNIACQLIKPAKQSEVFDAIVNVLGTQTIHRASAVPDQETAPQITRKLKVLLVEDNIVNQKLAVGVLSKDDHEVTIAGNGQEAIDHWREQKFDLILMDVQMPVMDGFEATRKIRELEKSTGSHTPILAMTARAMEQDRQECLDAGMDDYLSKPIRIKDLSARLQAIAEAADSPIDKTESIVENPLNDSSSVDWEFARSTVNDDEVLLKSLVATLLKESPRWIKEIGESVTAGDLAVLQLNAHTLKGSLRFLGEVPLAQSANVLETMACRKKLEDAPSAFEQLKADWRQLEPEIRRYLQS